MSSILNWKKLEKEYNIPKNKFNLIQIIEQRAKEKPALLALHFQKENGKIEKYNYKQLLDNINKYANLFKKKRLKKKERVAFFLPKCPEIYFGMLAVIKLGAIAMPLFEAFQSEGLELRLERGDVNFLVTDKKLLNRYKKIKNPKTLRNVFIVDSKKFKKEIRKAKTICETILLDKKESCYMIFTSSTAGTPVAGIMLPHQGAVQWIYTAKEILGIDSEKRYFCSAHPAWVTGAIYGVLSPFLVGATVFSIQGRFDAKKWRRFILKNRIENIYTAPTVLRLFRGSFSKKDSKYIDRICSVGEALPWNIVEHYEELGIRIIDSYWQTEIGAIVVANLFLKKKSLGRAFGVRAIVRGGEMLIKTSWPAMMTGIWKHNKMFKSYFSKGYFLTHDLVKQDSEGYFYFEGRKDDIIKTSGERVSPLEIEDVLIKHPLVRECAIIGVPDKERGSILKAFIVPRKKIYNVEKQKQELSDFVKENYAGHTYPKIIEFVVALPKGNSGKILRSKLG